MDLKKLKGRPPYPFETVAVAIAYSPRMEAIVAEAGNLAKTFGAKLLLIHAGNKTDAKADKLQKILAKRELVLHPHEIIWKEGKAVDIILDTCKEHIVDLLVLGALKKESLLSFYLGSLARTISRKAKCSVLLVTQPSAEPRKPSRMIVTGVDNPKTLLTVKTAVYFAEKYSIKEIRVVQEVDMTGMAMTLADNTTVAYASKFRKDLTHDAEDSLHTIIRKCKSGDVDILEKTVKGKPGYAIGKYAKDKKADLLVINSPDQHLNLLDRIFTHDMEYILADLPCDVLLVHSRNHSEK